MGRMECVTPIPRNKQVTLAFASVSRAKALGSGDNGTIWDWKPNLPALLSTPPSEAFLCHLLQVPVTSILTTVVVVLTGFAVCCSCSCQGQLAPFHGAYHLWGLGKRIKAVCCGVTPLFFPPVFLEGL